MGAVKVVMTAVLIKVCGADIGPSRKVGVIHHKHPNQLNATITSSTMQRGASTLPHR